MGLGGEAASIGLNVPLFFLFGRDRRSFHSSIKHILVFLPIKLLFASL